MDEQEALTLKTLCCCSAVASCLPLCPGKDVPLALLADDTIKATMADDKLKQESKKGTTEKHVSCHVGAEN